MPTPFFRALVLDFGEVLVRPQRPESVAAMARRARVAEPAFTTAYWAHRRAYDLHGDAGRFWEAVLSGCGSPVAAAERPDAVRELVALDVRSWTDYREEMWELAAQFRARGGKLGMLSNGVPQIMDVVERERALDRTFDTVVVSCAVGLAKPERGVYELVLARLGVAAAEALFVDDLAVNVAGAEAVGLAGLQFTGEASVGALRARLGLDR
jgi:putative hydrolase of the HAD superfamily